MPALILYLLKVNVALVLFYLAYHFVLRRLTFYTLNRYFLLFGIVFSTAYPFMDVSGLMSRHKDLASAYINTVPVWVTAPAIPEQTPAFDYWQIPVFLFWLGTGAMAIRLLLQLLSLYKIRAASEPASYMDIHFRQVTHIKQAFSFWQAIYLNPAQFTAAELESVLRHEQVHLKGWHTLDVLLAELNTMFYWFNPGAWLMKKAVKENLEFIADQKVICAGVDRKAYQYLLLKVVGVPEPQLANQFNFPSLKRRIAMMNKIPTNKANQFRLLIALPLVAVLLLAFRGNAQSAEELAQNDSIYMEAEEQGVISVQKNDPQNLPNDYKAFLKRNPDIIALYWVPKTLDGDDKSISRIVIERSGVVENYHLNNRDEVNVAEKKYGQLPKAPITSSIVNTISSSKSIPSALQDGEGTFIFIQEEDSYYKNNLPEGYKAFLKRNPTIKQVGWKFSGNNAFNLQTFIIYLKSGIMEEYNYNGKLHLPSVEAKYGKLPVLPPPPPPMKQAKKYSPPIIKQFQKEETPYIPDEANQTADFKAFLKRNPDVKQIGWTLRDESENKMRFIHIYLESGAVEVYNLYDRNNVATAENKYGKLPALPPPPPPVTPENN